MRIALILLVLLLAGPGLLALGVRALRDRAWRNRVPAVELLVDHAAGVEPPPRTPRDRQFALFNAWARVVLGGVFTVYLVASLFSLIA